MTTKEYLNQSYRFDKMIKSKLEEIKRLENVLTYKSISYDDVPKGSNNKRDDNLCKLVDLQIELDKYINEMFEIRNEISKLINRVENHNYKLILTLRYLNFKSFKEIAREMDFSYSHCMTLHKNALKVLDRILNNSK